MEDTNLDYTWTNEQLGIYIPDGDQIDFSDRIN